MCMEREDIVRSLLESKETDSENKLRNDEFIDEHVLASRNHNGKKEMKIKIIEISDEVAPSAWKLGNRVKIDKILITIKHCRGAKAKSNHKSSGVWRVLTMYPFLISVVGTQRFDDE